MVQKMDNSQSGISYGIRIKLQFGFLVVLLLTLFVGGVGYYGMFKINSGAEDLGGHWLKATTSLAQVVEDTEDYAAHSFDWLYDAYQCAKCFRTDKANSWA